MNDKNKKNIYSLLLLLSVFSVFLYVLIDNKREFIASPSYLESLLNAANSGEANAAFRLGNNYRYGYNGLEPDVAEAIKWYTKAVELDDPDAMNNLALIYINGDGAEQDFSKAKGLLEKAVNLKNGNAYANLGMMYLNGQGVQADYKKAFDLFSEGARLENSASMQNLGSMYHKGLGVNEDVDEAFKLYMQAADSGYRDSKLFFRIGQYYDNGEGSVDKDANQARIWYEKAAALGESEALRFLGYLYYDGGDGIQQDYLKAGEYFSMASSKGNDTSQKIIEDSKVLCDSYKNNDEVMKVYKSCFLASSSGDAQAMHVVGVAYNSGSMGLELNHEKAFEWLIKSAKLGHSGSQVHLGMLYDKGEGVERDKIEAFAWFSVADMQNDLNSLQRKTAETVKDIIYKELSAQERLQANIKVEEYKKEFLPKE